jgi:hypothetical protein
MTQEPVPFTVEPPVAESRAPAAAARVEAVGPSRRVAVFVCHGMGQQVRFQTIDGVATALQAYAAARQHTPPPKPAVRIVKLGRHELGRAELKLEGARGTTDVHVYEGYWAPLTEGRITLRATVVFFLKSGWQGTGRSLVRFTRYLFGRFQSWPASISKPFQFAAALLVVLALIAINVVQAGVLLAWLGRPSVWISVAVVPRLTQDLLWLLVPATALAALFTIRLALPWDRGDTALRRAIRRVLDAILWVACAATAAAVVFTAALMVRDVGRLHDAGLRTQMNGTTAVRTELVSGTPPAQDLTTAETMRETIGGWAASLSRFPWWPLVWAGVAVLSLLARWWILQYLGDVAIYLSSYRVSAYYAIRDAIQDLCTAAARAVYEHGGYEQHVFVGHSLGSVIAYDTLNRLLLDEAVGAVKYPVRARTRGFITFGSPLDKTAYLFRVQADARSEIREGLAAAIQPLIDSYDYRPEWINLWSRADPISGRLDYYDDRSHPVKPIVNAIDPSATTPLAAHTQYWRGTELYSRLYAMVILNP